jgi:hypothetical protein
VVKFQFQPYTCGAISVWRKSIDTKLDLRLLGLKSEFGVSRLDNISQAATDLGSVSRVVNVDSFLPSPWGQNHRESQHVGGNRVDCGIHFFLQAREITWPDREVISRIRLLVEVSGRCDQDFKKAPESRV